MEATKALEDDEKGRLIDGIVLYARGDEGWREIVTGNERFAFPVFQAQMDRTKNSREKKAQASRENGKKGGRPRKVCADEEKPTGFFENLYNNNNEDEEENEDEYEDPGLSEEDEDMEQTNDGGAGAVVAEAWQKDFGAKPNPAIVKGVVDWAAVYRVEDPALVREAVSAAALRNASDPLAYIRALFRDWSLRGVRGVEDLE